MSENNRSSYQKVVTLQKKYGKTGSIKCENGTLYIGDFDENGVKGTLIFIFANKVVI